MSDQEVIFEQSGRAGIITLNRPKALNALTLGMVRQMHDRLDQWAGDDAIGHVIITAAGDRAFCAGGDIRQLYEWGLERNPAFLEFYRDEYLLDTCIKTYPKPYVAVMDGITMGGGVGVSVHGSHRIATERLSFAMPETGIGLFPDVGGSYFLPRCPGETGMYLGLTGHRLTAADSCYLGIATHHVPVAALADLIAALAKTRDIDGCLAEFAGSPGDAEIAAHRAQIDRHFAQPGVAEIIASLDAAGSEWSAGTARILETKSPTSLEITFRQISRGKSMTFRECMQMEYRIVNRIFTGHDFFEGTRAAVIDKDRAPKWRPQRLGDIDPAAIERYFDSVCDPLPV